MIRVLADPVRNIKNVAGGRLNDLSEADRASDWCAPDLEYPENIEWQSGGIVVATQIVRDPLFLQQRNDEF